MKFLQCCLTGVITLLVAVAVLIYIVKNVQEARIQDWRAKQAHIEALESARECVAKGYLTEKKFHEFYPNEELKLDEK